MNNVNEQMACKEQEIPAETKINEILVENTFELLKQLESKINPILSADCVKSTGDNVNSPNLESPLGRWFNDQNTKLELVNEMLRDFCRRVRL